MAKAKELVTAAKSDFDIVTTDAPEWLPTGTTRGTENITTDDMIIPRIEVIQALSPARNKKDSSYIEGAEEGMLFNNVTRELYGESVTVIPVFYTKQYLIWKDRKLGGGGSNGFRGAFNTREDALAEISKLGEDGLEAIDTAQHFVLVHHLGQVTEAVLSMSKSKMKVSKRWNSLVRMTNMDSFARAYTLSSVEETNARNESYYNFNIAPLGFVNKSLYDRALQLFTTIKSGGVKVSNDYDAADVGETEY